MTIEMDRLQYEAMQLFEHLKDHPEHILETRQTVSDLHQQFQYKIRNNNSEGPTTFSRKDAIMNTQVATKQANKSITISDGKNNDVQITFEALQAAAREHGVTETKYVSEAELQVLERLHFSPWSAKHHAKVIALGVVKILVYGTTAGLVAGGILYLASLIFKPADMT